MIIMVSRFILKDVSFYRAQILKQKCLLPYGACLYPFLIRITVMAGKRLFRFLLYMVAVRHANGVG